MKRVVARSSWPRVTIVVATALGLALAVCVGAGFFNAPAHAKQLIQDGNTTQLPLSLSTDDASQVVTVVADSTDATDAALQAWQRVAGGWVKMGRQVTAHVATGGLTSTPAEFDPATPLGSYSLTQAFGKLPNPGTKLPYFQSTPADWWISQPGPLYNTHQFCTLKCPFVQGDPNARLTDQIRAYNYAVVIDYNRFPVVPGAGSAYFLHVTTAGAPTHGCISMAQADLVAILNWLIPDDHPRILIGIR